MLAAGTDAGRTAILAEARQLHISGSRFLGKERPFPPCAGEPTASPFSPKSPVCNHQLLRGSTGITLQEDASEEQREREKRSEAAAEERHSR